MDGRVLQEPPKKLWVVTDGDYIRARFLKPVSRMGATIIARLDKDAALYSLPERPKKRKRGRPRKYGQRIDLRSKAANKSR